jgi:hypothetical protein
LLLHIHIPQVASIPISILIHVAGKIHITRIIRRQIGQFTNIIMGDPTWGCKKYKPERTFESLEQQRSHALQYHAQTFKVTFPGSLNMVTIKQTNNVFTCP